MSNTMIIALKKAGLISDVDEERVTKQTEEDCNHAELLLARVKQFKSYFQTAINQLNMVTREYHDVQQKADCFILKGIRVEYWKDVVSVHEKRMLTATEKWKKTRLMLLHLHVELNGLAKSM